MVVHGPRKFIKQGLGLFWRCPREHYHLPVFEKRLGDFENLGGRFSFTVYYFGIPLAEAPMVVNTGMTQVFVGEVTEARGSITW